MNKHLESALAKLRECANSTMFVEVTHDEAAALLSMLEDALIATVENANMLDDAAVALEAMKAKIEAADRLASYMDGLTKGPLERPEHYDMGVVCSGMRVALATYRTPQPAGGGE